MSKMCLNSFISVIVIDSGFQLRVCQSSKKLHKMNRKLKYINGLINQSQKAHFDYL